MLSPLHAPVSCCLVQPANVLDTSRQIRGCSTDVIRSSPAALTGEIEMDLDPRRLKLSWKRDQTRAKGTGRAFFGGTRG